MLLQLDKIEHTMLFHKLGSLCTILLLSRPGFTYKLYRLKPRAFNKLWYAQK